VNNQRNRFGGRKTEIGKSGLGRTTLRLGRLGALAVLGSVAAVQSSQSGLQPTLSADQRSSVVSGQRADLIDDLIDIINALLGSGGNPPPSNPPPSNPPPSGG